LTPQAYAEMKAAKLLAQAARHPTQTKPPPHVEFRGNALALQTRRDHELILSGPAETGKTFATVWRLHSLCRDNPNTQAVIIRKTLADIAPSVLQTYQKKILPLDESVVVKPYGGSHPEWFDYPNGSRIWLGGMDKPGKVLSSERDLIYINQAEQLTLEDWETLTTRATGRAGNLRDEHGAVWSQIFGDCNPGSPTHWIRQRERQGALTLLESRHEDNPRLFDADRALTPDGVVAMATLDALTGVRKQRLRFGRWVQAEGVVYEEFSHAQHVIDEMPRGWEHWRKFRVVDFGLQHPFVCMWFAVDGDGRMYRYRLMYMTGRTVRQHAADILRYSANDGYIETTVCDHDAEDRATLDENGIPNIAANKAVLQGIGKVQDRLRMQIDHRPRLFFLKNALVEVDQTLLEARKPVDDISEFELYVWANNATKEQPVKEFDHGMDCTRYGVMHLDSGTSAQAVSAPARVVQASSLFQ
jgi:PBSX family phage terminase large subunit